MDRLKVAWIYRTGAMKGRSKRLLGAQAFEDTPTLIDGSLIVCTPFNRIIALDPATGKQRWSFDPQFDPGLERPGIVKCRGVSRWVDPAADRQQLCARRIIFGTGDFRAFAIDSRTGKPCPDFGTNGEVVFKAGKKLAFSGEVQIPSPPAIIGDVAIFGSTVFDNYRYDGPSGKVRALDARTGKLRWEFDAIPRDPDDPAAATWGGDSATVTGHANVWSIISVDEERDLVFLPTSSPGPDFYGGRRPGQNRYANSIVALRGSTGEMVWSFQIVHHDLWDYDLPAQPILADLPRNGKTVPAVIVLTKQGLIFTFHRETGKPLFPIEERPVPQGAVKGEWLSPTQPFPTLPPPIVAQAVTPDDAWGFTFIDRWLCRRKIKSLRSEGIYTPPSLRGTIQMPSYVGGANWGGGAYDPQRNILILNSLHVPGMVKLLARQKDARDTLVEFDATGAITFPQNGTPYEVLTEFLLSPLGVPCTPPPWGRLTAVDMATGRILWQVPLGSIEKFLPVAIPWELGTPAAGGPIVTGGGLVFIAATMDDKFRAFDVRSGAKLWEAKLPAGGQATPMTYRLGKRQFVVIAAGGHALYGTTPGDYVIAYAVDDK